MGEDSPRAGDGSSLPDYSAPSPAQGPAQLPAADERTRSRSTAMILTVAGAGIVLLAIVALVLSQTVLHRADPGDYAMPASGTAHGHSEYVPNPHDPDVAPPPPIFTQAPSTECTVLPQESTSAQPAGKVRGGGLEYTLPSTWNYPWANGELSYVTDVAGNARHVEGNWYSVVNLGRVSWPKKDGSYPGAEKAAVEIFQCYATSAGLIETFGDSPKVTDYRTEATSIDGTPGWIVQATYHFDRPELKTTHASVVTTIVVDTPGGPSALVSDAAADVPAHAKDLQDILASLRVVS